MGFWRNVRFALRTLRRAPTFALTSILLVAVGVDAEGHKHVLGIAEGASENQAVAKGLLGDLVRRGLKTDRKYLFVIDGSKALRACD